MFTGDRRTVQLIIYTDGDEIPSSSEISVTATYETDRGRLRVQQKTGQLPLKMLLRAGTPETNGTFSTIIKCSELVNFSKLFPGNGP